MRSNSAVVLSCSALLALVVTLCFLGSARADTTIEQNVDRPGQDMSSFDLPASDPELCRQACEQQGTCKAYTYVKPGVQGPTARCWLKAEIPPPVASDCCISGVKVLPAPPSGATRTAPGFAPGPRTTEQPSSAGPMPPGGMRQLPPKPGQKPGPLGRGAAIGGPQGTNTSGWPLCTKPTSTIEAVIERLDSFLSELGIQVDIDKRCGRYQREIATGVTLQAPPPPAFKPKWGLLGGRGRLMADSMMCLLKDVGQLPGGEHTISTPALSVSGVKVAVQQTIGLTSFDPVARRALLTHKTRICGPFMGCFFAQRQTFEAQVRESAPAWPSGYKLFDYPIADSYAVEVASDWSQMGFSATINPPLTFITPYGTISAKPELKYESRALPIASPFAYDGPTRHEFRYPGRLERHEIPLQDHYGRAGVPFTLNVIANLPGVQSDPVAVGGQLIPVPKANKLPLGWVSQVGLGARDGAYQAKAWKPGAPDKPPYLRQDFNMNLARGALEVRPTAAIDAGVPITFSPPNPASLFPGLADVGDISLKIVVRPSFRANYASQFNMMAREGLLASGCDGGEIGSACGLTESVLMAQSKVSARVGITGEVHLKIKVPPFFECCEPYPFNVLTVDQGEKSAPGGGVGTVEAGHKLFAWAGHAAVGSPENALWQGAQGYSGMKTGNLKAWTEECFKTNLTPTSKPEPPDEPGDPRDLMPDLLPCNICAVTPTSSSVAYQLTKYKAGLKQSSCKQPKNTGCYDLCSWNKKTGAWIQVEKTAAEMFGAKCGGISVK